MKENFNLIFSNNVSYFDNFLYCISTRYLEFVCLEKYVTIRFIIKIFSNGQFFTNCILLKTKLIEKLSSDM